MKEDLMKNVSEQSAGQNFCCGRQQHSWGGAKLRRTTYLTKPCIALISFYCHGSKAHSGPSCPNYRGFKITLRHSTLSRTPLHEWLARRRYLYLTKHNTHKGQTSIQQPGLEPTTSASERSRTVSLYRAATGIGFGEILETQNERNLNLNTCSK
jgi:hypothetical protein